MASRGGSRYRKNAKTIKLLNKQKNNGLMICEYCNKPLQDLKQEQLDFATVDHYIPIAKGGTHALTNLKLCCKGCNHEKGCIVPDKRGYASFATKLKIDRERL
jgi:5-methylcytosine-specific restriction endonuclease McrA